MKKILFAFMTLALCLTFPLAVRGVPQSQTSPENSIGSMLLCSGLVAARDRVAKASSLQEADAALKEVGNTVDQVTRSHQNEIITSADKRAIKASLRAFFEIVIEKTFYFQGMPLDAQTKEEILRTIESKTQPIVENARTFKDIDKLGEIDF